MRKENGYSAILLVLLFIAISIMGITSYTFFTRQKEKKITNQISQNETDKKFDIRKDGVYVLVTHFVDFGFAQKWELLEEADRESFVELEGGYGKDKDRVFWGIYIIEEADPNTFEVNTGYHPTATDISNFYYLDSKLDLNPENAEYIGTTGQVPYFTDQEKLYLGDTEVTGISLINIQIETKFDSTFLINDEGVYYQEDSSPEYILLDKLDPKNLRFIDFPQQIRYLTDGNDIYVKNYDSPRTLNYVGVMQNPIDTELITTFGRGNAVLDDNENLYLLKDDKMVKLLPSGNTKYLGDRYFPNNQVYYLDVRNGILNMVKGATPETFAVEKVTLPQGYVITVGNDGNSYYLNGYKTSKTHNEFDKEDWEAWREASLH